MIPNEILIVSSNTVHGTWYQCVSTTLGDVLEFIKNQKDKGYLARKARQKAKEWMLDIESVNAINIFAGAGIPIESAKEGLIDMCRATEGLIELGREEGIDKQLVKLICKKLSKVTWTTHFHAQLSSVICSKPKVFLFLR